MKILVTGGAGFIGSHVTKKLLDRGDEVVCVDEFNDYYSPKIKELNVAPFLENEKYKLHRGTIVDLEFLRSVFEKEKPSRVIHLAARAGVRPSIENPFIYEETNVKGTLNLLQLSAEHQIENFVLTSSSSVYGATPKIPFLETDPVDCPISPYAATKKATELLGHVYHHVYGLNVNVVRPFTVYGPAGRPDMVPFLFTKIVDEGGEIKRFGDGSMKRDFTFVGDLADGVISACDKIFGYEIFNLGNSTPVELGHFISVVEKVVGKKAKVKEFPIPPTEVPVTFADLTKSREMLGYDPKVKIEEGMQIFADWYQKNKHLY